VIGYEIAHAHIHLLPTNEMADFAKPGTFGMKVKPDLAKLAALLKS
jgi:diadenosine tetraphosphate (Ap4A) HIT family hydrolase